MVKIEERITWIEDLNVCLDPLATAANLIHIPLPLNPKLLPSGLLSLSITTPLPSSYSPPSLPLLQFLLHLHNHNCSLVASKQTFLSDYPKSLC